MGETEQFQGRVIFMSMLNDIVCLIEDIEKECIPNSTHVSSCAKRFPAGHWTFLGLFGFGPRKPFTTEEESLN